MSETLSLARFTVSRFRLAIAVLVALVIMGIVVAFTSTLLAEDDTGGKLAITSLFLSLMPAGIAALVLFDTGVDHDLMSPRCNCNEWLLRLPLPAWKIAAVPIALKAFWVSVIWTLFALSVWVLTGEASVPVIAPCLAFSAGLSWIMAVAWRPVRNGWQRLGMLALLLPIIYLAFASIFIATEPGWQHLYPLAVLVCLLIFALGSWQTCRSVELARSHSLGIIPPHASSLTLATAWGGYDGEQRRDWPTPTRALVWHDLKRAEGTIRYTGLLVVLPVTLFTIFVVPLNPGSAGTLMFLCFYFGLAAASGMLERRSGTPLVPDYVATSPVGTATIAWTRLLTVVGIMLFFGSTMLVVTGGWALSAENREAWLNWSTTRAADLGDPTSATVVGARWCVAFAMAMTAFMVGRVAAYLWVEMVGRTWVSVLVVIVVSLAVLSIVGAFLRWFMTQTSWEGTAKSAETWLRWAPLVAGSLLSVKAFASICSAFAMVRSRLTRPRTVAIFAAGWCLLTLAYAGVLYALIPDPRVTFLWCLAGTAIVLPIARTLFLPFALSLNRHR